MKKILRIVSFLFSVFLCCVFVDVFSKSDKENGLFVSMENECILSAYSIPDVYAGNISNGITIPVQSVERNNSNNNLLRQMIFSKLLQGGALCRNSCFSADSFYKLYTLSSPFYCTPASRYYVFALRRLII